MLDGWRHSGFNVFVGERIQPREKKSLENLAAYQIRATFCQKRMDYSSTRPRSSTVRRTAKRRKPTTPWNGWPPWEAMSRKKSSSLRATTALMQIPSWAESENGRLRGRAVGSITCPVRIQYSFQYIILFAFQRTPCSRALFLQNTLMHWSISSSQDVWSCATSAHFRHAYATVHEMREGPSEPACRGRLETTSSCAGKEPGW